jgi:hypothetical protein
VKSAAADLPGMNGSAVAIGAAKVPSPFDGRTSSAFAVFINRTSGLPSPVASATSGVRPSP